MGKVSMFNANEAWLVAFYIHEFFIFGAVVD